VSLRKGSLWLYSAPALLAAFAACGGLDKGEIIVVPDGSGGEDSTPSGGKANTGGSDTNGGTEDVGVGGTEDVGVGGNDPGVGGAAGGNGGEGGEPPIVISDDPPAIVSISPEDLSTGVEPGTTVTIEFTESVDPATLAGAIVIKDGARVVPTTIDVSGVDVNIKFAARLDLLAEYSVSVSTAVKDLAGTALKTAFSSSFKVRDGKWGHLLKISNATGSVSTQSYPSPVWDAQGNGLVVWAQATASAQDIWARFYHPTKGWSTAAKLNTATTGCSNPAVAMNSTGDAVVSWAQSEAPNVRVYARRYLKGAWESKPLRVDTFDITNVRKIVVGMSETGDSHVLWRYDATYQSLYGSHAAGAGAWYAADTYITGSFDDAAGPTLSFGADGNGFMVYSSTVGSASSVRVGRYLASAGNGWTNFETLTGSTTVQVSEDAPPTIAIDAKGGAMAAWIRTGDVATSRFTKAGGWTAVAPADTGAGSVASWAPRLANTGDDFMVFWHQSVGNVRNAFANRYTGTTWGAQNALLSNGLTSVHEWSDTGFGLDRHGNGIAVWCQGDDVRSSRYLASSKEWQTDTLVEKLDTSSNPVIESLAGVSPNGMAAAMYAIGYPYHQTHNAIYGAIFE
jgi:Bacterial Ig-like domain